MAQENSISQELADLLVTHNFDPEYRDEGGQSSGPADANTVSFDYRSASGNNYGSAVAVIGDDNELMLFFGDNLGRSMEDQDKDEWFAFLNQMRKLAQTHRYTFSPQNLSRLKHSLAGQAAVKEGLFEGYYGSRRESFIGEPTEARILIKHNKIIGEDDKRYRYIESIFIETADGERFKLQSNRLIHGRAMLEHVRQGGRPYDVRGNHINEMVQELSVLSRFNRAKQHHVYEGITQELVESAAHYYRSLQENLKRLSSSRGYHTYFESWAPDQIDQQESLVEDLKNMFVQQTLDTRIEAALPTLAKIQQQGTKMKEAEIFENYMNRLSEGTWALPDTPEAYEKLQQLMTGELIVGADAMNATEQLYDLVGDDELFDILNDLADNDPRANIWDDSDVQRRLAELGVQTPQSTQAASADVPQDTAPEVKEGDEISMKNPGKFSNQEYKDSLNRRYGQPDLNTSRMNKQHQDFYDRNPSFKQSGKEIVSPGDGRLASKVVPAVTDTKVDRIPMNTPGGSAMRGGGGMGGGGGLGGRKPGDDWRLNMLKLEDAELARMLEHAGVPHLRPKNRRGVGENSGDSQITPGMKTQYGIVMSVEGNTVTVKASNGELTTVNIHDIEQGVAEGGEKDRQWSNKDMERLRVATRDFDDIMASDGPEATKQNLIKKRIQTKPMAGPKGVLPEQGVAEGDNRSTFVEDRELAEMLKYADVPIKENVLTDSTGSTLDHIMDTYKRDVKDFEQTGEMSRHLQQVLYDYYYDDMPYGAKTGDSIDPHEWISDRFAEDLGINENLISPMSMPVSEGSCNMTAEGSYCPEHGLAECGSMYEDGGAVGMPYSMGEAQAPQDPINSNSAMTGSYYEGKETDVQEGDALLARIKSLALLR